MQIQEIGERKDITVSVDSGRPNANRLREREKRVKIRVEKEISKKGIYKYIRGKHINKKYKEPIIFFYVHFFG